MFSFDIALRHVVWLRYQAGSFSAWWHPLTGGRRIVTKSGMFSFDIALRHVVWLRYQAGSLSACWHPLPGGRRMVTDSNF